MVFRDFRPGKIQTSLFSYDSGYPHDGRADKNPYVDSNNQCIILRLQPSFVMNNEQMMLV